jgi:hypothetical protein
LFVFKSDCVTMKRNLFVSDLVLDGSPAAICNMRDRAMPAGIRGNAKPVPRRPGQHTGIHGHACKLMQIAPKQDAKGVTYENARMRPSRHSMRIN